jgi:HYDIN/CFA65/VesB-like, Ig-like domain
MGKWFLRDWTSPQRVLIGTLTDVHDSSGILDGGDNDTNLEIVPRPEPEFQDLLKNRQTPPQVNKNGLIECEVNVGSDWRSQYEFFVNSLVGREVTAQGVFVDDDGHGSKTELHPMDVIFARVADSQLPGDWIGALASRTVTITNTGHADLVITIAPPVQHAVFTWEPVSGQAIAPGASVTVDVEFSPPGAGQAQGQLRVDSNAAGSPHIVTLQGMGVKGSTS